MKTPLELKALVEAARSRKREADRVQRQKIIEMRDPEDLKAAQVGSAIGYKAAARAAGVNTYTLRAWVAAGSADVQRIVQRLPSGRLSFNVEALKELLHSGVAGLVADQSGQALMPGASLKSLVLDVLDTAAGPMTAAQIRTSIGADVEAAEVAAALSKLVAYGAVVRSIVPRTGSMGRAEISAFSKGKLFENAKQVRRGRPKSRIPL